MPCFFTAHLFGKNRKEGSYEKVNVNNSFAGANGNTLAGGPNTGPSLGYWKEGDPGTTHEFWDFTPASQNPGNHIQFYPKANSIPMTRVRGFSHRHFLVPGMETAISKAARAQAT